MYQVYLKPRAIKLQKDAYDWYELQQDGLGELFLKELDEHYGKLKYSPKHTAKTIEITAVWCSRNFPT